MCSIIWEWQSQYRIPMGRLLIACPRGELQADCLFASGDISQQFHGNFPCETLIGGWLTCLEGDRVVGGALTVVWDGGDGDQVALAAPQHGYLAAGRLWRAGQRGSITVHRRGPIGVRPKHPVPRNSDHATWTAVVHWCRCHWVYCWGAEWQR